MSEASIAQPTECYFAYENSFIYYLYMVEAVQITTLQRYKNLGILKRIGLLSDTHGTFDETLKKFFADVDEIWHAGDFGNIATADEIAKFKPLRGVYGNIDGGATRVVYPEWQMFMAEDVRVMMTHIGGHPNRYERGVEMKLKMHRPTIFISGHSHILKIIYDKKLSLLHLNPGAAGSSGFHHVRTALRFTVNGSKIEDMEVGEWQRGVSL